MLQYGVNKGWMGTERPGKRLRSELRGITDGCTMGCRNILGMCGGWCSCIPVWEGYELMEHIRKSDPHNLFRKSHEEGETENPMELDT